MTERDFIEKWSSGQEGDWWLADADRLFWAAAYQMPRSKLSEMSEDFMSIEGIEKYSCSWDLAAQTNRYEIIGPIRGE